MDNQIDTMIEADILSAVIEKFVSPDINLSPKPVYMERQRRLSYIITHGLKPGVSMKKTGIRWIGSIPAHWNCVSLKRCAKVKSGITLGKKYPANANLMEVPSLRVANVQNGHVDLATVVTLCRFQPVSEPSLQQMQENKLFFSSADRYDDPFDTYFYINVDEMIPAYEAIRKDICSRNAELMDKSRQIAAFMGIDSDVFLRTLSNTSLDFEKLKEQLAMVRNSIQRRLFSICFCEDPYNETLWLKYAGNYSGFVLIYDLESPDTFMCGKEEACQNCKSAWERPYIYPVCYSNMRYNATKYAMGVWLIEGLPQNIDPKLHSSICNYIQKSLMWEIERICLIKKKCHEYDQEWRMIRPAMFEQRSCIKMKPSKIIVGLRTPQYERKLIVSAATIAGVKEIHELYIDGSDKLNSKPINV